jgi:F-type H+-transporting ATPase subunit b
MILAVEGVKFGLVELNYNMLFQLTNTLVMFLFLRKLLFKPVTEFVQKRQDAIDNAIQEADQRNAESEALRAQLNEKLSKAEDEGRHIIREAAIRAEARAAEIIKEAESEIAHLKVAAAQDMEHERRKALNALKDEIAHLTILAASKVVERDIDEGAHRAYIQQFIDGVGDSKWQN